MNLNNEELRNKIIQYFEKSIESSGAFDSGDPEIKELYVKSVLNNDIEKEIYQIIKNNITISENTNILDMGCGLGSFLEVCQNNGIQAIGIDIDPHAIEIAKSRTKEQKNVILEDCQDLPFKNNSFDLIVSITVIEHVKNPLKYFREAHRVLAKNGKLIIFAPNYLFPWEGHYKLFWIPYLFPHTKSLFKLYLKGKNRKPEFVNFVNFKITPGYLKKLIRKAGFSEIKDISIQRFKERINNSELINDPKPQTLIKIIKRNRLLHILMNLSIPLLGFLKLYHPIILIIEKKD